MICNKCGNVVNDFDSFCPNCGNRLSPVTNEYAGTETNDVRRSALSLLRDSKTQYICIAYTAGTVLSFAGGKLPLVPVLMTIFLWLTYSSAKKGPVNTGHMRKISGTIYANYILGWIGGVVLIIGSIFASAVFLFSDIVMDELYSELAWELGLPTSIMINFGTAFIVVLLVMLLAIGVVSLVMNFLGMRNIHRFAQSLYKSAENPTFHIRNQKEAKTWLMVYAVYNGITALTGVLNNGFINFAASICWAAAMYLGSKLIDEYFINR